MSEYSDKMASTSNSDVQSTTTMTSNDSARNSSEGTITSVSARSALTTLTETHKKLVMNNEGDMGFNYKVLGMLTDIENVKSEGEKRNKHLEFKNFIEKQDLCKVEMFKNYLEEFDPFHYRVDAINCKIWYNASGNYHRTTKDANGLTLPAYAYPNGDGSWYVNGKNHRTDKDANGLTLPARIVRGRQEWFIEGRRERTDLDEFGNTMPAEITSDGSKRWFINGAIGRSELGKNAADKDYNRALPAIIPTSGSNEWWYGGRPTTQDELTKILGGRITNNIIDTDCRALNELLIRYQQLIDEKSGEMSENFVMIGLLISAAKATTEDEKNLAHRKLREYMLEKNIANVDAYMEECESYHYLKQKDGAKKWQNKSGEYSRTTRGADGLVLPAIIWANGSQDWYLDGNRHRVDKDAEGNTLPAMIKADGEKQWYIHGECKREGHDEFGHSLPTQITAMGSLIWTDVDGSSCRMELGKNPADKDFGKALPAVIRKNGEKQWATSSSYHSQDQMTKLITGKISQSLDCEDIKGMIIKMKNGNTFELNGDFTSVQVLRS